MKASFFPVSQLPTCSRFKYVHCTSCNHGHSLQIVHRLFGKFYVISALHVSNLIVMTDLFLTFPQGSSFHVSQFPTSCSSLEDRCPLHHICNNGTLSANRALLIGKFSLACIKLNCNDRETMSLQLPKALSSMVLNFQLPLPV